MSEHAVVTVDSGAGHVRAGAPAWCAACREWTEFVVPTGLRDPDPDELACLQCGWAVLVSSGLREGRDTGGRDTGRRAA